MTTISLNAPTIELEQKFKNQADMAMQSLYFTAEGAENDILNLTVTNPTVLQGFEKNKYDKEQATLCVSMSEIGEIDGLYQQLEEHVRRVWKFKNFELKHPVWKGRMTVKFPYNGNVNVKDGESYSVKDIKYVNKLLNDPTKIASLVMTVKFWGQEQKEKKLFKGGFYLTLSEVVLA